jgi:hypothetical protein
MKVVKIEEEANRDTIETFEHALKLAKAGKIIGLVGAFKMRNGVTRKIVHGVFLDDIPKAIGELETVKMWLFGELELHEVPDQDDELKEIEDEKNPKGDKS